MTLEELGLSLLFITHDLGVDRPSTRPAHAALADLLPRRDHLSHRLVSNRSDSATAVISCDASVITSPESHARKDGSPKTVRSRGIAFSHSYVPRDEWGSPWGRRDHGS